MSEYILQDDLYLGVTPAGSYYAVQDNTEEVGRTFLRRLLQNPQSIQLNSEIASNYSGLEGNSALEFIHWMQNAGMVYGTETPEEAPQEKLEEILPSLLQPIADSEKVVIAESQGFYLGASGFAHEASEELAAMSTELIKTYDRHKLLLNGNLRLKQRGWGIIDGTGSSEIGFWPLFIGDEIFTLIAEGMPQFNQAAFRQLIWALSIRYDNRVFN